MPWGLTPAGEETERGNAVVGIGGSELLQDRLVPGDEREPAVGGEVVELIVGRRGKQGLPGCGVFIIDDA